MSIPLDPERKSAMVLLDENYFPGDPTISELQRHARALGLRLGFTLFRGDAEEIA